MTRVQDLEISPRAMAWIEDPGHAWLAVPLATYPDAIESGTGFGFLTKAHAFLEEDVEAVDFINRHPDLGYEWPRHYVENLDRNGPAIPKRLDYEAFKARWYGRVK